MEIYESLLKLSYELEGLVSLRVSRGADPSLENLIEEKVREINLLMTPELSFPETVSDPDDTMFYSMPDDEEVSGSVENIVLPDCPDKDENSSEHQVSRRRPLLSVNDRFRFRRELFAGSDDDFNSALGQVAAMDSYEEAENYFFSELEWNPDDPVVGEFMEMMFRYYKKQPY